MISVAQGAAHFADRLDERIVRDNDARPDGGHEFVLGEQTPRVQNQLAQDLEGLRTKLHLVATSTWASVNCSA